MPCSVNAQCVSIREALFSIQITLFSSQRNTLCGVHKSERSFLFSQTALLYSRNQNRTDEFYHLMCQNSFIIYQNYLNIFCRNSILYAIFVGTVLSLPFRRNSCILHPIFFSWVLSNNRKALFSCRCPNKAPTEPIVRRSPSLCCLMQ